MKSAPTPLIICFLAIGIFLAGTGCEQKPPSSDPKPSPEQQWESQVLQWKNRGYSVLDVVATERWAKEHPRIVIKHEWFTDLGFLGQKSVEDGSIITRDYHGNLRVVVFGTRLEPSSTLDLFAGFMTAEESEQWLRNNGYQVKKDSNGYIITRNITREGFNYKDSWTVSSGPIEIPGHPIPDGYVNIDRTGRLRVKVTNTQQ